MTDDQKDRQSDVKTVALFATCLVDLMRPNVGFASACLLEQAGYDVVVPEGQTCCGQPAYNGGDRRSARRAARHTMAILEGYDYVVVPSGSCAAMICKHYPALFSKGGGDYRRAMELSERTYELTTFLRDVAHYAPNVTLENETITYHDSCAGLRELHIQSQPRDLLNSCEGIRLAEMNKPDTCCGFGGTFCIKYPDISDRLVERKAEDIVATGATRVVAGDVGCILNMEGKLHRQGASVSVSHVAEILAGMVED